MAVCVKTLSTVMKRGEAALVFVAGFADIEDLHALFTELPAHCAVEAFPFHSLISPEEQVGRPVGRASACFHSHVLACVLALWRGTMILSFVSIQPPTDTRTHPAQQQP